MNPGALRERVTIQSETRTADTAGGAALSWSEVATVWANVEPQAGQESVRAEQLASTVAYRVTIRYRDDVQADDRLLWRGSPLQIRTVSADRWRQYLTLFCEIGENT